jgi:spore coat protein U-like protein
VRTLLLGLLIAVPVRAATCTQISAQALPFGSYDVFATLPRDTSAKLFYNCTAGPAVTMSAGINNASPRQMFLVPLGGGDLLKYDIFVDSTYGTVWAATPVVLPSGDHTVNGVPYYGRIYAGQDVAVGNYWDAIIVTFNF